MSESVVLQNNFEHELIEPQKFELGRIRFVN